MNILRSAGPIVPAQADFIVPIDGHIKSVIPGPGHDHWLIAFDSGMEFGLGRLNTDLTPAPPFGAPPEPGYFLDSFDPLGSGFQTVQHMVTAESTLWVFGLYFSFSDFQDHIAVARYHLDGTIDKNFGTAGRLVVDLPGTKAHPFAWQGRSIHSAVRMLQPPELLPNGKMLFFFSELMPDYSERALLIRLTAEGELDTSFSENDYLHVQFDGEDLTPKGLLLQGEQILVYGHTHSDADTYSVAVLGRFTRDGTLDRTFGDSGFIGFGDKNAYNTTIHDVVFGEQERIVVAGTFENPSYPFMGLLSPEGNPDPSFNGGNPKGVITPFPVPSIGAIALQRIASTWAIVLAATADISASPRGVLIRLTADGNLDSGFGDGAGYQLADRRSEYLTLQFSQIPGILVGGYVNDEIDGVASEFPWLRHFSVNGLPGGGIRPGSKVIGIR